jgi:hypothetical protein
LAGLNPQDVTYCIWSDLNSDTWLWGNYHIEKDWYDGAPLLFQEYVPKQEVYIEKFKPKISYCNRTTLQVKTAIANIIQNQILDTDSVFILNPKANVDKVILELKYGPAKAFIRNF